MKSMHAIMSHFNMLLKAFKDALDFSENNVLSFAQCHKWRGRETKRWEMVTWDKKGLKIMIIVGENFLNSPINIMDIYIYIYIKNNIYLYAGTHTCMHAWTCTWLQTYIHTCIHRYIDT